MQSKVVQCFNPQDLKVEIDLIIAADAPTWMSVVEMIAARGNYVILWV